ncbi:hypothetical protein BJF85_08570 [Saccharomonospora sp. CUA-673]|nr:hypothetical protein BJF85_08570 [Saccharomonospora sp. CUA-673]
MEFLVSLDDGSTSDSEERRQRAEALAPELRLTPHEVLNRIHTALALTHRMPRLLDAMRDGQVDRYGAERVLNVVAPVSDDDARVVDQLLLDKLATMKMSAWQPRNMAWHASKLVQDIDPGAVESAARMARDARKVVLDHWPNAMSRLSAELRRRWHRRSTRVSTSRPTGCTERSTTAPSTSAAPTCSPTCYSATNP